MLQVQSAAKKGLRMFYSEDETDSSDDGDKLAITTAYGLQVFIIYIYL